MRFLFPVFIFFFLLGSLGGFIFVFRGWRGPGPPRSLLLSAGLMPAVLAGMGLPLHIDPCHICAN